MTGTSATNGESRMDTRMSRALRVITIVLAVAIVGMVALFVRYLTMGWEGSTPTTELERAVIAAEAAVKADPESAPARVKLAAAYLENNAVSAAREQAQTAIKLAPQDPSGYYVLGLIESKAGNTAAALKQLGVAANTQGQIAGFYQDVWRATASVHSRSGDTSEAIAAMGRALDYGPENAELFVARAALYEQEKRWADALYDYTQATLFVPDFEPALEAARTIAADHPEAVEELRERFGVEPPEGVVETSTAR